jgi:hypothetical protein
LNSHVLQSHIYFYKSEVYTSHNTVSTYVANISTDTEAVTKITHHHCLKLQWSLVNHYQKSCDQDREVFISPLVLSQVAQSGYCLATAGQQGNRGLIPGRSKRIFPLASATKPALGPIQPPVQWVPGGLKHCRGMTLTNSPHLVPRLRMSRSYICSPPKHLRGV